LFYLIYQVISWLLFVLVFPIFLVFSLVTGKHRTGLGERLGHITLPFPNRTSTRIWLHAASVGELQAAKALIPEIKKLYSEAEFIVSTVTEQGNIQAQKELGQVAHCIFAPLDLLFFVKRSLKTVQPDIYICLETELWPTFIKQAKKMGIKLFLLNGRLSEKSFRRYKILSQLTGEVLSCYKAIGAITPKDAERFKALGVKPENISTLGNVKYDSLDTSGTSQVGMNFRQYLQVTNDQPVLVAGSTRTGEDELLLSAFKELWNYQDDMILVLAPRHLNRLEKLTACLNDIDIDFHLWSALGKNERAAKVIILDTMGELAQVYSAATLVFCGGSLVNIGGHNPLEAAAWGKPIIYGPYMQNVADVREMLEPQGAGFTVNSAQEITKIVRHFLDNPAEYEKAAQMAKKVVTQCQGAAQRQAKLVLRDS